MRNSIDQIKSISIIEVANRLGIDVKRNNKANCFKGHDNKTPSLSFNIKDNYFKCFGCGIGGSNIDLVMSVNNCDTGEAIQWLKDNFGISSADTGRSITIKRIQKEPAIYKSKATSVLSEPISNCKYSDVYEYLLTLCPLSEKARSYLEHDRGFTNDTIIKARIALLENPRYVFSQLLNRYGKRHLSDAGLIRVHGDEPEFLYWDKCILFPFIEDGNIIYLQARRSKGDPKYLNMMGNISKPIYNIDCLQNLSINDKVYICEGIPDTLTMAQSGRNAIGILGVQSFKEEYINILKTYNIVLCGDGDTAGQEFNKKVGDMFQKSGKTVTALRLPQGKDINQIMLED